MRNIFKNVILLRYAIIHITEIYADGVMEKKVEADNSTTEMFR